MGPWCPLDKVYEAITTPAKRRKIVVLSGKPRTQGPSRRPSLGKELFAEMGPDGEDGLVVFLQNKLKGWQTTLTATSH